jgi:hypothetical protein
MSLSVQGEPTLSWLYRSSVFLCVRWALCYHTHSAMRITRVTLDEDARRYRYTLPEEQAGLSVTFTLPELYPSEMAPFYEVGMVYIGPACRGHGLSPQCRDTRVKQGPQSVGCVAFTHLTMSLLDLSFLSGGLTSIPSALPGNLTPYVLTRSHVPKRR